MTDSGSRTLLGVGLICVVSGFYLTLFAAKIDIGAASILIFGFALMAWPALSERLQKLSFSSDGLSLELRDRLSAVEQTAAGAAATVGALTAAQVPTAAGEEGKKSAPRSLDDPQKGRWGGQSKANGRVLTAKIEQIGTSDIGKISLSVSPETGRPPLKGPVTFHLHDSFRPFDVQRISPGVGGSANLELASYGAFTVGVEADGGPTQLEYDLTTAPGAFQPWKSR